MHFIYLNDLRVSLSVAIAGVIGYTNGQLRFAASSYRYKRSFGETEMLFLAFCPN